MRIFLEKKKKENLQGNLEELRLKQNDWENDQGRE